MRLTVSAKSLSSVFGQIFWLSAEYFHRILAAEKVNAKIAKNVDLPFYKRKFTEVQVNWGQLYNRSQNKALTSFSDAHFLWNNMKK